MSKIVTNIITRDADDSNVYGTAHITVENTETGEVRVASVDYSPTKSQDEAIAEGIEEASNKF